MSNQVELMEKSLREIIGRTEKKEIIWKVGGEQGLVPRNIGRMEAPYIASCYGMDLMLYEYYENVHLKISNGEITTDFASLYSVDQSFSGTIKDLFQTVDGLIGKPIRDKGENCEQHIREVLIKRLANIFKVATYKEIQEWTER